MATVKVFFEEMFSGRKPAMGGRKGSSRFIWVLESLVGDGYDEM